MTTFGWILLAALIWLAGTMLAWCVCATGKDDRP
jgi:hypothetical protein